MRTEGTLEEGEDVILRIDLVGGAAGGDVCGGYD
jgi:hypothetical protein